MSLCPDCGARMIRFANPEREICLRIHHPRKPRPDIGMPRYVYEERKRAHMAERSMRQPPELDQGGSTPPVSTVRGCLCGYTCSGCRRGHHEWCSAGDCKG